MGEVKEIGEREWVSWLDLEMEYREAVRGLKRAKEATEEEAGREILGSMEGTTVEIVRMLREKLRYERNAFSVGDLKFLTKKQREVVELRRRGYSTRVVAEELGISPSTVHTTWLQAVGKIRKARKQKAAGIPVGLSNQQEKIYMLRKQGLAVAKIAEELGAGKKAVQVQIRRIEAKIGA